MDPIRKCISLGGPHVYGQPWDPNSNYGHWWNRNYALESGAKWVKMWVSPRELLTDTKTPDTWNPPNTMSGLWNAIDSTQDVRNIGYPAINNLTDEIRQANGDGIGVILTVTIDYPGWMNGTTPGTWDPQSSKPWYKRWPDVSSPDTYWGWFISFLLARYWDSGSGHPTIQALEVLNEPNGLTEGGWPQSQAACTAANALMTAEAWAYYYHSYTGRYLILLGPGTADTSLTNAASTSYYQFTSDVVSTINSANYNFRIPTYWSHHNYEDVKDWTGSRAWATRDLLYQRNWRGWSKNIWLTEGGFSLVGSQAEQRDKVVHNYNLMRGMADAYMWTQHMVLADSFNSGVREAFNWNTQQPGPERLLFGPFRDLPSTSTW
jgi:hypothetical protein